MPEDSRDVVASSVTVSESKIAEGTGRLRLAHVIDSMSISGGSELNAVRTVEQLRETNDVVVLTLNGDGGMASRYERAGVEVREFPVDSLIGRSAWRQMKAMATFLREANIDIVHSHDCYSNFLATGAARLARTRGVIASKRWIRTLRWQHRWTNIVAYNLADRVLANSTEVARTVRHDDLISKRRVVVIPNFVDDERFSAISAGDVSRLRSRLGYTTEQVVFVIVAQLRSEKRHAELIETFALCVRQNPALRLLVVGDGPERERLAALIQQLHLGDSVNLTGHMADGLLAHAAGDVSVLVSAHEGFPNSLVEAAAAAKPIIATNVGGVIDAVENEVTGILVPLQDIVGLERAILRLGSDPHLRQKMGAAGKEKAWNQFRRSVVIPSLQRLYMSLAGPLPQSEKNGLLPSDWNHKS